MAQLIEATKPRDRACSSQPKNVQHLPCSVHGALPITGTDEALGHVSLFLVTTLYFGLSKWCYVSSTKFRGETTVVMGPDACGKSDSGIFQSTKLILLQKHEKCIKLITVAGCTIKIQLEDLINRIKQKVNRYFVKASC
jgi:hypothetical protein